MNFQFYIPMNFLIVMGKRIVLYHKREMYPMYLNLTFYTLINQKQISSLVRTIISNDI